jgi:hypothetical protein
MPNLVEMRRMMRKERAWQMQYDAAAPKRGDLTPDFELRDVKGETPIRLSDLRGSKPVALIFGSLT